MEDTTTAKSKVSGEGSFNMHCGKCNQTFFLRTNWDFHLLFCGRENESEATSHVLANNGEPSQDDDENSLAVDSIKDALKISHTLEFIPLSESIDCGSCSKRSPLSSQSIDVEVKQLLFNGIKKTSSDGSHEVFECVECHRDYLFKHPMLEINEPETQVEIKNPERKPTPLKPYKCSICNRSFRTENEMYEHEVKHTNTPRRYSCGECNERFNTRVNLQEHYDSLQNNCQSRKCGICGKEFVHANHLRRHMSVHAGIKPHMCFVCDHEFNQKSDLTRHVKRHSVNGRLACVKCALLYDTLEELREHMLSHQSEKDETTVFRCPQCPKTFGRKSHFRRHISIHEGVKPHVCEECGKAFNQRSDLKRHHMMHERKKSCEGFDKPLNSFICDICQKVFPQKSILEAHCSMMHERMENAGVGFLK